MFTLAEPLQITIAKTQKEQKPKTFVGTQKLKQLHSHLKPILLMERIV